MNDEIKTIEYTLKSIFKRDVITSDDVSSANALFEKWKVLTNYSPDVKPILKRESDDILDDIPEWNKDLI
jgi:hypothetical protein